MDTRPPTGEHVLLYGRLQAGTHPSQVDLIQILYPCHQSIELHTDSSTPGRSLITWHCFYSLNIQDTFDQLGIFMDLVPKFPGRIYEVQSQLPVDCLDEVQSMATGSAALGYQQPRCGFQILKMVPLSIASDQGNHLLPYLSCCIPGMSWLTMLPIIKPTTGHAWSLNKHSAS